MEKKNKRKRRLNRGLIALGAFVLLCAAFVICANLYVKDMPRRMIALATSYYDESGAAASGIPAREYIKAWSMEWDDMTHAVVRVSANLTDTEPDMPFTEDSYGDLYDQFRVEFRGGKWVVTNAAYSYQGRWSESPSYEGGAE